MRIGVEAHAGARTNRVEVLDDTLRVWVSAKAVDGQANAAIEATLASALGLRNRQVQIISGARSRHKVVEVDLPDSAELHRRLAERKPA